VVFGSAVTDSADLLSVWVNEGVTEVLLVFFTVTALQTKAPFAPHRSASQDKHSEGLQFIYLLMVMTV